MTHIGLGSHSGPTLHPEGGQESQPHSWLGETGFPEGAPPWGPHLPHVPTERAATMWPFLFLSDSGGVSAIRGSHIQELSR